MRMEYCFGGLPEKEEEVRKVLKFYKEIKATSVEIYIMWKDIEPEIGKFKWDKYDRIVNFLKEYSLKLVPFLILGPWYVSPQWMLESKESIFAKCLEHKKESKIQSIWNPNMPKHIDRVLKAFAEHYLPQNVLESILLGISGDYGEAIFEVIGNWPGEYHTHAGYWCGDNLAIEDFRKYLKNKFITIKNLNKKWNSNYSIFEDVNPLLKKDAPSNIVWLDEMKWYRESMNNFADLWVKIAKRYFPGLPIYLCTGGDGSSQHGSDFSLQAKLMATHNGRIRITNEGSNYGTNFYLTRLVSSACKHYGADYGYEPASKVSSEGVVARIFGAVSAGAIQLHEYTGNVFRKGELVEDTANNLRKNYKYLLSVEKPIVKVAAFYPHTFLTLKEIGFTQLLRDGYRILRDLVDFDLVDERMIEEGVLNHYDYLIFIDGDVTTKDTISAIREWVNKGGAVLSSKVFKDTEGNSEKFSEIFGFIPRSEPIVGLSRGNIIDKEFLKHTKRIREAIVQSVAYIRLSPKIRKLMVMDYTNEGNILWANRFGKGCGVFFATEGGNFKVYTEIVCDFLENINILLPHRKSLKLVDGKVDNVFSTETEDKYLFLNMNNKLVEKRINQKKILIDPISITEVKKQ